MLSIYPACFFEEEKHYSVIFPDFNYLSTCGDSLQDAMEMAVDCLAGALFSAKLDNEDIPIPSKLEKMDPTQIASELEFEFKQSFVTLVSVDVEEYAKTHFNKAIKKTLTIPEWLNKEAMSKRINFSQVLQEALIAKLHSMWIITNTLYDQNPIFFIKIWDFKIIPFLHLAYNSNKKPNFTYYSLILFTTYIIRRSLSKYKTLTNR